MSLSVSFPGSKTVSSTGSCRSRDTRGSCGLTAEMPGKTLYLSSTPTSYCRQHSFRTDTRPFPPSLHPAHRICKRCLQQLKTLTFPPRYLRSCIYCRMICKCKTYVCRILLELLLCLNAILGPVSWRVLKTS